MDASESQVHATALVPVQPRFPKSLCRAPPSGVHWSLGRQHGSTRGVHSTVAEFPHHALSPAPPTDPDPPDKKVHQRYPCHRGLRSRLMTGPSVDFQPVILVPFAFPSNNFKHFLTLFSKFFASFPHGTCSLSVSRQYLVLDGIYHPLEAAIPSNPTRRKRIVQPRTPSLIRDSHPL